MTLRLFLLIQIAVIFPFQLLVAQCPKNFSFKLSEIKGLNYNYIYPNEKYPHEGLPILSKAPEGVYIAVGTDRGFNNASLTPATSHLLLLDVDPNAVRFNTINTRLLKASSNRQDYLGLRLYSSVHDWRTKDIGTPEDFEFWKKNVREGLFFRRFHSGSKDNPEGYFSGANYLHYDGQFERIWKLAKEDRIFSALANLADINSVREVVSQLSAKQLTVGVLDLSNAWGPQYMFDHQINGILAEFSKISKIDSFVYLTFYRRQVPDNEFVYSAFTFKVIESIPNFAAYGWSVQKRILRHLNVTKLFDKLDEALEAGNPEKQ